MKQDGTWIGYEVDVGSAMARHMNLKVEPVKVNDKTWRTMLSRGQIDAALCRIRHTRSLDAEFDFSEPYFFDSLQVMTLKGAFKSSRGFERSQDCRHSGVAVRKGCHEASYPRLATRTRSRTWYRSLTDLPALPR